MIPSVKINVGPNLPEHYKHFIRKYFETQLFEVEFIELKYLGSNFTLIADPERSVSIPLSKKDMVIFLRVLEGFKVALHYYRLSQKYLNTIRTKRLIKQPI